MNCYCCRLAVDVKLWRKNNKSNDIQNPMEFGSRFECSLMVMNRERSIWNEIFRSLLWTRSFTFGYILKRRKGILHLNGIYVYVIEIRNDAVNSFYVRK